MVGSADQENEDDLSALNHFNRENLPQNQTPQSGYEQDDFKSERKSNCEDSNQEIDRFRHGSADDADDDDD
jgi:hypothetical protein